MGTAGPPCASCGWMLRWTGDTWACDRCGARITPPPRRHSTALVGAAIAAAFVAIVVVGLAVKSRGGGGRSREELVDKAVAAVAAGDVDTLVDLAGYDTLRGRLMSCDSDSDDDGARIRRRFERAAVKHRDVDVSVVDIDVKDSHRLREGSRADTGCRYKADATSFELKVTVKVGKNGRPGREQKTKVEAIRFAGSWYLVRPPELGAGMDDMLDKMKEMSEKACACKDKSCADRVNDEFTKWGTEMAKNADADTPSKMSEEDTKAMTDVMKNYTDCLTKAMTLP